jgi:hypothetical protein
MTLHAKPPPGDNRDGGSGISISKAVRKGESRAVAGNALSIEKGGDWQASGRGGLGMKKLRGRRSPSLEQISLATDCAVGRMPIVKAAELIGVAPRTLWLFAKRINLPGIFGAWKDRPRYVPVSSASGGSRTGKSVAAVLGPGGVP